MANIEEWRCVPGFEGAYEVSSLGRVKRLPGFRDAGQGRKARVPERVWAGHIGSQGYPVVNLGRVAKRYVHRLVCEAFHGTPPSGKSQVAHYDGDKTNNVASNLRWADWTENRADGKRLGEMRTGERHARAVLTSEKVEDIRRRHQNGEGMRQIGRSYGICHQHVGDIIRRRIWKED